MAFRTVVIKFINEDGLERVRTIKQEIGTGVVSSGGGGSVRGSGGTSAGSGTGTGAGIGDISLPQPEDIFLDNPITLPIKPIDFSDLEIDLSNLDFGIGDIGPIGPIFAPGGGTTVQGWNNGDPKNNWGMGATSVGGVVAIDPPKLSTGGGRTPVLIPPAPPQPVTPNQIKITPTTPTQVRGGGGGGSGSGTGRGIR